MAFSETGGKQSGKSWDIFGDAESASCMMQDDGASSRHSDVDVACRCHCFVLLVMLLSFTHSVASGGNLFLKNGAGGVTSRPI